MTLVREVSIENYKSIRKVTLDLGRVNVLIGANGSGKSNLLEGIALGTAAAHGKLDNEYLVPRGIRVTEARFMRSAFPGGAADQPVKLSFHAEEGPHVTLQIPFDRSTAATSQPTVDLGDRTPLDALIEGMVEEMTKDPRRGRISAGSQPG